MVLVTLRVSTSFLGSLILPPPQAPVGGGGGGEKMKVLGTMLPQNVHSGSFCSTL